MIIHGLGWEYISQTHEHIKSVIIPNLLVHGFIIRHLSQKDSSILPDHISFVFNYSYQIFDHWLKFLDSFGEGVDECNSTCTRIHKAGPVLLTISILTLVLAVLEKLNDFFDILVKHTSCELMRVHAHLLEVFAPAEWMKGTESVDL